MAIPAAESRASRPLLTFGRVDRFRVQVGYRVRPDGPAYLQYLLELPVPDDDAPDPADERALLAALEPVVYAGAEVPRHYSLHQHRWHTSWGPSPGAVDLGLMVTLGPRSVTTARAADDSVCAAFLDLLGLAGLADHPRTSRDTAVTRARDATAAAYSLDPATLSLSAEEHHLAENAWTIGIRTTSGRTFEVEVGFVDGYAGSVRVRDEGRIEVSDSVGSE